MQHRGRSGTAKKMERHENRGVIVVLWVSESGTSQKAEQKPVRWIGILGVWWCGTGGEASVGKWEGQGA